jgi:hypothetical protein
VLRPSVKFFAIFARILTAANMETYKNPRWLFPTSAATNPIGRGTLVPLSAQAAGIGSG